jgi:hypothetical protein
MYSEFLIFYGIIFTCRYVEVKNEQEERYQSESEGLELGMVLEALFKLHFKVIAVVTVGHGHLEVWIGL